MLSNTLPAIPNKRYFTIGEVSTLCAVKPHVLRYWEQEFQVLRPSKRRGNRRYYRLEDVTLVRQIKTLLYEEGYTISGARNVIGNGANLALKINSDSGRSESEPVKINTDPQPPLQNSREGQAIRPNELLIQLQEVLSLLSPRP